MLNTADLFVLAWLGPLLKTMQYNNNDNNNPRLLVADTRSNHNQSYNDQLKLPRRTALKTSIFLFFD